MLTEEQKELGDKALKFIEENPGEWSQEKWKTCFAGILVHKVLGGYTNKKFGDRDGSEWEADATIVKDDIEATISQVAREALGLNYFQVDMLFSAYNSLEDLKRLWGEIKDGVTFEPRGYVDAYY